MKRAVVIVLAATMLAGCSSVTEGTVTGKDHDDAWTDQNCHWVPVSSGKTTRQTWQCNPIYYPETWTLLLEDPDTGEEGWVNVDVTTYYDYEIGEHYGRGLADTGTIAHRELPIRVVVHQSDVAEPSCNTLVHRIYRNEDRIIAVVSSTDPKVMEDLKTGASVVSMDLFVDGPTATYQGNVIATSWKIIGFALMDATTSAW